MALGAGVACRNKDLYIGRKGEKIYLKNLFIRDFNGIINAIHCRIE
ncbi:hypothetical protein ACFVSS_09780 [Peribacillus butanolivorans]